MASIRIERAKQSDIPLINQLAERIWRVHYPSIISHAQIDFMLDMMYSPVSLQQQMDEGYVFFLVKQDFETIGYISIGRKSEGEYFLSKFYLDQKEQGKGLGKSAFALMVAEFPDMEKLRLQVNRRNYKSVNFYFRLGFVIESSEDFDIGNGYVMDDFVMLWKCE
jgi:diamine N-acetyltransferase